jgi:hypothetical protein
MEGNMKSFIGFIVELNHATVGLRKVFLSVAGLLTLMHLASMKADPAYAWMVGAITVPALASVLGERFGKLASASTSQSQEKSATEQTRSLE